MKRLGIFQMNDSDGLVDEYVLYLLNNILPSVDELTIVINGTLQSMEAAKLYKYTDKLFFRKNEGYDATAYKEMIIEFLGLEFVQRFDELVLFNNTFFGPFYSFKKIFQKMENKKIDFWGLTLHAEYRNENKYMPEHIQSYFLVIKKNVLKSSYFEKFWLSLDSIETFQQLVDNFEVRFTTFFSKYGFKYAAYVEDDDLNGNPKYTFNHYAYIPYTLMDKYGMPVLKRKDFTIPVGVELTKSIWWIEKNTNYDINMIWKNIIRTYNIVDLKENLNLVYILPDFKLAKKNSSNRAVVLAYLTNENLLKQTISYLQQCPDEVDVIVLTYKKKIYDEVCKGQEYGKCIMVPDYGKEFAFISGCKNVIDNYKYLCFVHDEYDIPIEYYLKNRSLDYLIWENTLSSSEYIGNVLLTLEENRNLGILSVPEPTQFDFLKKRVDEWEEIYPKLQDWINQMSLNCKLEKKKRAFTFSSAFWCKTDAIRKIAEYPFVESDFKEKSVRQCIKYILLYIAQDAGYYSGLVETLNFSKMEVANHHIFINSHMFNLQKRKGAVDFARQFEKIYIYGAGRMAQSVKALMDECRCPIEKFVVTDSHRNRRHVINENVIAISKVPNNENIGIIVALNAANTQEIKPFLIEQNYKNVFYMSE